MASSFTETSSLKISNIGLHLGSLDEVILWGNIRYYFTTSLRGSYTIILGHIDNDGNLMWYKISDWMRTKEGLIIEDSFGATLVKAALESFEGTLPILNLGEFYFHI